MSSHKVWRMQLRELRRKQYQIRSLLIRLRSWPRLERVAILQVQTDGVLLGGAQRATTKTPKRQGIPACAALADQSENAAAGAGTEWVDSTAPRILFLSVLPEFVRHTGRRRLRATARRDHTFSDNRIRVIWPMIPQSLLIFREAWCVLSRCGAGFIGSQLVNAAARRGDM